MNRLDEIENESRLWIQQSGEGDDPLSQDILALVAVARAAAEFKSATDNYDDSYGRFVDAHRALCAALAPLLEETGP